MKVGYKTIYLTCFRATTNKLKKAKLLNPWQNKKGETFWDAEKMSMFYNRQLIEIQNKTTILTASQQTFGPSTFVRASLHFEIIYLNIWMKYICNNLSYNFLPIYIYFFSK